MKEFYLVLKNNKNYRKLLLADAINAIGDIFDSFALSFFVYALTGSKFWFALNFAINAIPNLIIQPFLGVLIERLPKKLVMVASDFGRAILVIILIVLNTMVDLNPIVVLVFTFFMTCLEAFRQPAAGSILPQLLKKEDYDYGISTKSTLVTVVTIGANAVVGLVIAKCGINVALMVDAISFILSGMIIYTMTLKEETHIVENTYVTELKEGWYYFKNNNFIFSISILMFVVQLFLMGFNVVLIPYFNEVLFKGPEIVSYFTTVQLIGQVLSTVVYPKLHEKIDNRILISGGGIVLSLSMIGLSLLKYSSSLALMITLVGFLLGIGAGTFQTALSSSFYEHVEPQVLARTSALTNSFSYAAIPLGSFLTSALMVATSMEMILFAYGIIMIVVFVLFTTNKKVR